jgi:hypothetical protein
VNPYTVNVFDLRPYSIGVADYDAWRTKTREAATAARIPCHRHVAVVATPLHVVRAVTARAGACIEAVDAMIDGLVDAKVLPSAKREHLHSITLDAPIVAGRNGIRLELHDLTGYHDAPPAATWLLVPLDVETFTTFATREGTVNSEELGRAVVRLIQSQT